jgi:hypothetical protein
MPSRGCAVRARAAEAPVSSDCFRGRGFAAGLAFGFAVGLVFGFGVAGCVRVAPGAGATGSVAGGGAAEVTGVPDGGDDVVDGAGADSVAGAAEELGVAVRGAGFGAAAAMGASGVGTSGPELV